MFNFHLETNLNCMIKRIKQYLVLFCYCFFSAFSVATTLLGEERANLGAFCALVRYALVWFCLFPLPYCVWEGLRFVIMALPGLSSYLFGYSNR